MRRAALLLVLASLMAGCTQSGGTSTGKFKGPERDVADQIADFSNAASRGEESKACTEQLSKALRDTIAKDGKSCPSELGKAFDDASAATIKIDDITIDASGDAATADVAVDLGGDDGDAEATWTLVDEDGDWRIDSFGEAAS